MQTVGKFLGMLRVWRDGEQWKWVPVGQWAPEEAIIASTPPSGCLGYQGRAT
jgi:hypothetical protein